MSGGVENTLTLPCLSKSNTAKLQTYPRPSTCTVNSRKKSMMAGAQEGRENQRMNGVRTTEIISFMNVRTFISKSTPNS